ncbi:MAG: bifunctional folylpolyglutamate synthase/dihydrofolate synthase [Parachlamydiaceae bacterium]|nr:bifunctional folylpolyglutamate synthase/dihydrofolate synthase [Parachlamydiaceae bacterium]
MQYTYVELLERLFSVNLHSGIKLGLDNCQKLNEALGYPVNKFPSIHIAGTNGKGSVSTKIAAAFEASGKRVGIYTSPHIACFRERIRINGEMISEDETKKHLLIVFKLTEELNIPATFFEITTLVALNYFAMQKVDIAVIETGLGGRLDATNIVHPLLTIITSISLDHTEILGNTLEEITLEKAGIIKPGIPIVVGPRVPTKPIQEIAALNASPYIRVEGSFDCFQAENNSIAATALNYLHITEQAIEVGLKATPPCRMETWLPDRLATIFPNISLPKALIFDVAHNPDGISHLIAVLHQQFPGTSIRFIIGLSKSKDIFTCINLIKNAASHIYLVEAPSGRAAPIEELSKELLRQGFSISSISCESSISLAVQNAIIAAGQLTNEIVVVCGTFFIMSAARAALGIVEPQDLLSI